MTTRFKVMASIAALTVGFGVAAVAQNLPPVGPTGARAPADGVVSGPGADGPIKRAGQPGYDHPNQHLHRHPVSIAENMEPVIRHPDQDQEARQKLAALEARTGKKPNVLIFLLDDVGYADFGFTGGGITVGNPTPDIDRIAAESLILTSAYAQPTCSPTRASILTGQFPVHHGIQSPPMYGQPGGLEGLITLPKLMSEQGYTTQAIGKWHVGENEGSQPHNVGFDNFRGFLSVSDMYTEWRDPTFNPEIALSPSRTRFMQDLPFSKDDIHAVKGGEIEKIREITPETMKNLDQEWLKYGQEFLRKQADTNKPFFLYYGTRGCHFDNYPNEYYAGRSPARTVYSDCIVEMNDIFARLYQTLEETGQLENTLIVFTSDNGPEAEVPPYGRTWFRGGKGSTWEGGVRVPTFVHWKGMIGPRKSEGLFDLCDLFNTALSLAGKPGAEAGGLVPQDRYIDGIDQTSFVLAPNGESNRRSLLYFLNGQLAAVRLDEFKFDVFVQVPNAVTVRGQQGGITGTMQKSVGSIMFNLYTNPQEDDSTGIRHIPMGVPISNEFDRYTKVLKRFPERTQVSVQ